MNTYVTRILDEHGIKYDINKHQNAAITCEDAAKERGVPLSQILKCMVGRDSGGRIYVMLIPGDRKLKIKKLRHFVGGIKIDLIPAEELTTGFGLTVGAISPIQFIDKAGFYLDQTVLKEESVDISSGLMTAGIMLKTKDLVDLLKPAVCDIISNNETNP